MDDKPMLNSPVEGQSIAAEEFKKNVIGRMEGAHDARVELQGMTAENPEAQQERMEKFKQETLARFEELTGLTFDRDTGKCTTPGTVKMEGEFKGRWAALCTQLRATHDAQKSEQLWQEVGRLLRGETGTPE